MDKDLKLFELLSDGEFHSGEVIAKLFGVTRSRVWSLVNSLEEKGVIVSRVRGKGYRYRGGSFLLDSNHIEQKLSPLALYYFPSITSTNDIAREYLKTSDQPLLVVAEHQTGGRGRRGRQWASCYAHNLLFTYGVPRFSAMQGLEGLSLLVGLTLVDVVNASLGVDAKVKWPNDVLINGAKLAGVLVEIQGDIGGDYSLIIGVGLNVNETPSVDDREVTSLMKKYGRAINRSELLVAFVDELRRNINLFCLEGFSSFSGRWNEMDAYRGCQVQVEQGGEILVGLSRGVNANGVLDIEVEGELRSVHGGEVSLRAVYE